MAKINKIDPPTCIVIDPEGNEYVVNEYEFNDLRIQLMDEDVEWSVLTPDRSTMSTIRKGKLDHWPNELFSLLDGQLCALAGW